MTTEVVSVSAGEQAELEPAPKPAWHAPGITRIDIRRTMEFLGSGSDGPVHDSHTPSL